MTLFVFVISPQTPISNFVLFSERSGRSWRVLETQVLDWRVLETQVLGREVLESPGDSGSGLGGPGESYRLRFWIGDS